MHNSESTKCSVLCRRKLIRGKKFLAIFFFSKCSFGCIFCNDICISTNSNLRLAWNLFLKRKSSFYPYSYNFYLSKLHIFLKILVFEAVCKISSVCGKGSITQWYIQKLSEPYNFQKSLSFLKIQNHAHFIKPYMLTSFINVVPESSLPSGPLPITITMIRIPRLNMSYSHPTLPSFTNSGAMYPLQTTIIKTNDLKNSMLQN